MEYKAEVREVKEHIVYFKDYEVRDLNKFLNNLQKENIFQHLSDKVLSENPQIELTQPDYNVVLFKDGEFKKDNVVIEFCDAVTDFGKNSKDYSFRKVESFLSLNILHKGSFENLDKAYAFAEAWMKEHGYEKSGAPRNSAIDGFWNCEREEDYLTEVQIPIKEINPFILPEINIEKLFYLEAELHPDIKIGDVGRGNLVICPIKGGFFIGEKLKGQILNFGADWNLMYRNNLDIVDTRYILKTEDGELISLTTKGFALIEPELDRAIERGEYVDPKSYYFKQHLFFETGSKKYQWLNGTIAFAILGCKPTGQICYNAYAVK